jgi:hypothetical protein
MNEYYEGDQKDQEKVEVDTSELDKNEVDLDRFGKPDEEKN